MGRWTYFSREEIVGFVRERQGMREELERRRLREAEGAVGGEGEEGGG